MQNTNQKHTKEKMKKLLYLLLVIPFAMMFSSCNNDDDLPNVNVTMSFDNAVVDNGTVYVLQDEEFSITGITTQAVNSNQQSAIVNVRYFWNGIPAQSLTWNGFPMQINMEEMPQPESGNNILGLNATLLETDKSISYCAIRVPIKAVESEDGLINGQTPGQCSLTFTSSQSDK